MIDGSIFDAQCMSCCNVREYLPPKKDIKEFKSINDALDALPLPGFGAGVYTGEDNEEDIPRNAEMYEDASILSAMQVLFFCTPFPCLCMSQTLCPFLCILYVCVCVTRVGCTDDSHDQLRPRRGSCGRVQRGGVHTVRLGRRFN